VQIPFRCLGYLVGVKQTGEVQFFVRPYLVSDPRVHQHRSYELSAVPAGVWNAENPNYIFSADTDISGWLPANHNIFNGKSPENAIYGYNPKFLQSCGWPLRFITHAGLRWQRGVQPEDDPWQAFVPPEFYYIDETTIWWLDTNHQPWDSTTQYTGGVAETTNEQYRFRLWLDVTKVGHGLNETIVSSLRAAPNSGLVIRQYPYGGFAASGDLLIDHNLIFNTHPEQQVSGYAVRNFDGHNVIMTPNVAGIRLDSTWFRILQSDHNKDGYHFGNITIGDPTGKSGRELPFEAIHLNAVEEAVEREAIGLAFPEDRAAFFLARVSVPLDAATPLMSLSLFFGILLTSTGNLSSNIFKLSYRIIRAGGNNSIADAFPEPSLYTISCNFAVQNTEFLNGYYAVESESFPVEPGDIVFIRMERNPPDNFNDRIILLRKSALIHIAS
jgi:hypothetical protein